MQQAPISLYSNSSSTCYIVQLSDRQKIHTSILTAISSLSISSLVPELKGKEREPHSTTQMNRIPLYQFFSQVYSRLSSQPHLESELAATLGQLKAFTVPLNKMMETAADASSSVSSHFEQPANLLASLDAALSFCRQKQLYKEEYLLRKIFASLAYLSSTASSEEIQRAIELEQEHLDCVALFKELPGDDQEKYDYHLDNYLHLLSKFFGFDIVSQTLNEQFSESLNKLHECHLKDEALPPLKAILLKRVLSFVQSRPEWFFYNDRAHSKCLLLEVQEFAKSEQSKQESEWLSILLETYPPVRYRVSSPDVLKGLLNRISKLSHLSPSNTLMSLSAGVGLYEALAKQSSDPEKVLKLIFTTLNKIIEIGNQLAPKLNFLALQALAKCRFLFGFYSCLCFKKAEEFEKGRTALLAVSKDFWADQQTRQAAILLLDTSAKVAKCPCECTQTNQERFSMLNRFKLMLLGKVFDLLYAYEGRESAQCKLDKVAELVSQPQLALDHIWRIGQERFSSFLLADGFESAEDVIVGYLAVQIYQNQAVSDTYYSANQMLGTIEIEADSGEKFLSPVYDYMRIKDFMLQSLDHPLMGYFLTEAEKGLLQKELNRTTHAGDFLPCSLVQNFHVKFGNVLFFLTNQQGQLSYVETTQNTILCYTRNILSDPLIKQMLMDFEGANSLQKKNITNLCHHVPSMHACCALAMHAYRFSHEVYDQEKTSHGFSFAENSIATQIWLSKSNQEKIKWSKTWIDLARRQYMSVKGTSPDEIIENYYVEWLHAQLSEIALAEDPEEKMKLLEALCSDIPDTYEDIYHTLLKAKTDNRPKHVLQYVNAFMMFKSLHLIANQEMEKGLALLDKVLDKISYKGKIDFSLSNTKFEVRNLRMNLQKLNKGPYKGSGNISRTSSSSQNSISQEIEAPFYQNDSQEKKKDILENARSILRSRELKKAKKQARVPSSISATCATLATSSSEAVATPATPAVKKFIGKKAMRIFNCLWKENSPSTGPWETRSFRNDVKISRNQALKLIQALGGRYSATRGHGSHQIAHLPKIEFNGKDMGGLVDYDSGELMITLTDDRELKYYQIIQLRKILLSQGFNTDTVKVMS